MDPAATAGLPLPVDDPFGMLECIVDLEKDAEAAARRWLDVSLSMFECRRRLFTRLWETVLTVAVVVGAADVDEERSADTAVEYVCASNAAVIACSSSLLLSSSAEDDDDKPPSTSDLLRLLL